jgi:hypothetical protein
VESGADHVCDWVTLGVVCGGRCAMRITAGCVLRVQLHSLPHAVHTMCQNTAANAVDLYGQRHGTGSNHNPLRH